MNWLRKLWTRLRALFAKRKLDAEMEEEMRSHIEMQTQENIEAGMTPEEAHYAALRQFGHVEGIKETCRDQREGFVAHHLSLLTLDVRFALRQLLKNRGFTAVAVLTLAVAIGATTAIVSVVYDTVIDPLPVPDGGHLMSIESFNLKRGVRAGQGYGINAVTIAELRKEAGVFADLVVYDYEQKVYREGDSTELLNGMAVSPDFFSLWQVAPVLGRGFTLDEARVDLNKEIILSHRFWLSKLGGDLNVIGRTIRFGDGSQTAPFEDYTVVSVMPKHFAFPDESENFWIPTADPGLEVAHLAPGLRLRIWIPSHQVAFRLPKGVARDRAQAIVDTLSVRHGLDEPRIKDWRMKVHPARELFTDETTRSNLWMLLTVVLLVWLIACANVANLLIARAEERRHEMAARAALGASRTRLIRQMLTESLVLSGVGGLCGLVLTAWGIHTLDVFLGGARMKPLGLNPTVFGVSMFVATTTGIVFGLWPAWRISRPRHWEILRETGFSTRRSVRGRWFVRGLIVGEVALSVVVLAAAGLMVRSVIQVLNVDVGYRSEGLLRVHVIPPSDKYPLGDRVAHELLYNRLIDRFVALPGVDSVGTMVAFPGKGEYVAEGEDRPVRVEKQGVGIGDQSLFETLGTPLIEGRFLEASDLERNMVVVNETLARIFWPGQSAVGRQFHKQSDAKEVWEVAGVVGDVRLYAYDIETPATFFRLSEEAYGRGNPTYFFIRSAGDPTSLIRPVQMAIEEVEPDVISREVRIMSKELYHSTRSRRIYVFYVTLFAGVGLALAMVGIFGFMAHSVASRTREIGIRMALGAQREQMLLMVIRQGIWLTLAGLGIGVAVALALSRVIAGLLYETAPTDPFTFASVSCLFIAVAGLACWIPARQATKVDPMVSLRYE